MEYEIIRTNRKSIAIQITPQGQVVVRAPLFAPENRIRSFVESKADWICQKLDSLPCLPPFSAAELQAFALQVKAVLPQRTAYFAGILGVNCNHITVRAQRTRWGSCSGKGNLNFNCLLALVPPEVLDYVVVHELCHLKEMNHSPRFWAQVEAVLPDYKRRRKWLKDHGKALIGRLAPK